MIENIWKTWRERGEDGEIYEFTECVGMREVIDRPEPAPEEAPPADPPAGGEE